MLLLNFLRAYVRCVNWLNEFMGRLVSYLVYPMVLMLVWEVGRRYIFNRPTIWAHELSAFLYAVVFLLGGSYALRWNSHISVEILYVRLSPRTRAVLDLCTWTLFYLFVGLLLLEGLPFAMKSVRRLELAGSVWDPPIWPVKLCIPLGALLMLLQGTTKTIRDFHMAFTGRELMNESENGKGVSS